MSTSGFGSAGRGRGRLPRPTPTLNPILSSQNFSSVPLPNISHPMGPQAHSQPAGYSSEDDDDMFDSLASYPPTSSSTMALSNQNKPNQTKPKFRPSIPPIPEVSYERSYVAARSINAAWNNGPRNIDIVGSGIAATLQKEFRETINPFSTALDLMAHSNDFYSHKHGSRFLALEVMLEFKKWLMEQEKHNENFSFAFLKPPIQICAFEIVLLQRNVELVKLVFRLFQLQKMSKDFITSIKQLYNSGQYKEACIAAESLQLYDPFDIHSFVIPLILQDRESIALDYLLGSKSVQEAVLEFLDSIIGNKNQIPPQTYFRDYARSRKIENVKFEKLDYKPLSKLVSRFAAKFSIDVMDCTNTGREKRLGMVRHLMYRKYQINDPISDDAFHELLDSTISSDPELIEEIMQRLRREGDNAAAAKFGLRHEYPPEKCAYEIQVEMNKIDPKVVPVEPPKEQLWDEDWDITEDEIRQRKNERYVQNKGLTTLKSTISFNSGIGMLEESNKTPLCEGKDEATMEVVESGTKFYKCPQSNIQLINTLNGIDAFLKHVKSATTNKSESKEGYAFGCLLVGIDCEWKPLVPEVSGVALIQIALVDQIYLLDTVALKSVFEIHKTYERLVKEFFSNEEIIKIGYAFDGDFRMLMRTSPAFLEIKEKIRAVLDLSLLVKELVKSQSEFFPFSSIGLSGLSELVFLCTGEQVNKEEQFSDWEKRPLRDAQIQYAAADAFCLLDIFRTIKSRAEEFGMKLNDICKVLMSGSKKKEDKKKKLTSAQVIQTAREGSIAISPIESPFRFKKRNAKDIKLVCDNMCQGLGKHLRSCGIDTVILESYESHSRAVQYTLQENRYVVTTGKVYNLLAGMVPVGWCLGLSSDNVVNQLREVISYFNIAVTDDDIYTLCQKCNSNKFIQVSGRGLAKICHSLGKFPKQLHKEGSILEDPIFESGVLEIEKLDSQRHWTLLPETDLVISKDESRSLWTPSGASVGISAIPVEVFDYVEEFYICDSCGKTYWIGSQFRRGFQRIKDITSSKR